MAEITLKPSDVSQAVRECIAINKPVMLWGAPGIGKSDMVRDAAKSLKRDMIDLRGSTLDAVDVRGLPHVTAEGKSTFAFPDFFPEDGTGILFFDEINRALMMVQNALLQLVLDRRLGDYVLPKEWAMVAACNDAKYSRGVNQLSEAFLGRFLHINVEPDRDDWIDWAIANDVHTTVIGFLRFRGENFHNQDRNAKASPNPRSWVDVSNLAKREITNERLRHAMYAGAVGDAATELMAYEKNTAKLPNINEIIRNPHKAAVPSDKNQAQLYALSTELGCRADKTNFENILIYLNRLKKEYMILGVRDALVRSTGELKELKAYKKWAMDNLDFTY